MRMRKSFLNQLRSMLLLKVVFTHFAYNNIFVLQWID
jgi:hypothetical protein